jgi:crotonobetainyl-CoA:carnitine CoA-transferase CaiB-like acyl-CoA transferase
MIPLLNGVKVLELSAVVMGPFAGQVLAELGAEVL